MSLFLRRSAFIARSSEGDDRKWKRQMWQSCSGRKNGSAACGSSCQRLIKHKNQGHFSSWAISSEDGFLRGRGIKIHLDVHFSLLLSLNQTYLVSGANRRWNVQQRLDIFLIADIHQDMTCSESTWIRRRHTSCFRRRFIQTDCTFVLDYQESMVQIISIIQSQTIMTLTAFRWFDLSRKKLIRVC